MKRKALSARTKRIRARQAGPALTAAGIMAALKSGEAYAVHCPSLDKSDDARWDPSNFTEEGEEEVEHLRIDLESERAHANALMVCLSAALPLIESAAFDSAREGDIVARREAENMRASRAVLAEHRRRRSVIRD